MYKKGSLVTMTNVALENYGEEYRDRRYKITHVATQYMPAKLFYASGSPDGFHPGYDVGCGSPLYDLTDAITGEDLPFSLYGWEVTR